MHITCRSGAKPFKPIPITMPQDAVLFIKRWLRQPRKIAAVAPSGKALAELITSEIGPESGPILELGPGTGVFTRAMLNRGVPQQAITVVELDATFAKLLQMRHPGLHVLQVDAATLENQRLFDGRPAGAVVCGLGLLNMPEDVVRRILQGAFHHLGDGGSFFLFTYGSRCPVPPGMLEALHLRAELKGKTWRNIPPASVYRISRKPALVVVR